MECRKFVHTLSEDHQVFRLHNQLLMT